MMFLARPIAHTSFTQIQVTATATMLSTLGFLTFWIPPVLAAESWSRLFVGQAAVISGGGPFNPVNLCESSDELDDFNAGTVAECEIHVPYGAHVRVIFIKSFGVVHHMVEADIEVQSVENGWSGWVSSHWIMPVIPVGTVLTLESNLDVDDETPFYKELSPGADPTYRLRGHPTAKVLGQLGRMCKIRVLSGPKVGDQGYTDCAEFGLTNLAPDGMQFEF